MTFRAGVAAVLGTVIAVPAVALAELTGPAGGSQPHSTVQPSLAVNFLVRTDPASARLGDITLFGGNFAPQGWLPADGRLLSITAFPALHQLIGTTYGGDGQDTFALPDLRGRVPIGTGTPPGGSTWTLGETAGSGSVTLIPAQLTPHSHTLPAPLVGPTSVTGGGQAFNNMQPSLALNYVLPLQGVFPPRDTGLAPPSSLGFVELTSGTVQPPDVLAQGQLLPIAQNTALFSLLGTTYGGNGQTTFALPDLRGRAVAGTGGFTSLGEQGGSETLSLALFQLPAHNHSLPPSSDVTGTTGSGIPLSNLQPYLALNYIIALQGVFPGRYDPGMEDGLGGDDNFPFLGEIALFAGNFAPAGWAFAQGQVLSISQNTALFSLLGTTYGGNGQTTFALPDLRERLALDFGQGFGLDPWLLGQVDGDQTLTLALAEIPSHVHEYTPAVTVPEPGTVALLSLALAALGAHRRRRA